MASVCETACVQCYQCTILQCCSHHIVPTHTHAVPGLIRMSRISVVNILHKWNATNNCMVWCGADPIASVQVGNKISNNRYSACKYWRIAFYKAMQVKTVEG